MANPRQRRKGRSGTAKTSQSKASRKNMKKVTIKGPEILGLNWDKKCVSRFRSVACALGKNGRLARCVCSAQY